MPFNKMVVATFEDAAKSAKEVREALSKNFLEGNMKAITAIEWMKGNDLALYKGFYAEFVLQNMQKATLPKQPDVDQIKKILRDHFAQEQRHWSPLQSTSMYANSLHNAQYEAIRWVVERLEML